MRSNTAQVLEDNGGGLHIVTNDGRSVYVGGIAPTDRQAGQLRDDLTAVLDWIDDTRAERPEEADSVTMDADGYRVIAELDDSGAVTIYQDAMGMSGRAYAGLPLSED